MTSLNSFPKLDLADLPIRPDLRGMNAYGAPQLDVPVRLNTNENPHPPSDLVRTAILTAIEQELPTLDRYPDRDARALRRSLARYLGASTGVELAAEQVWAANGSNEVLQQLLQLFGGPRGRALGFGPTYSMHGLIARVTNTEYLEIPRDEDFSIEVAAATHAIGELTPTVTFICSPNNPTGTATPLADIRAIYQAIVAAGPGVLVVDEAYAEFSGETSALTLLAECPRLVVTRTLSKALAFAGGRVGYLAAHPAIVEAIGTVRLPYHLSALTQAAALAALANAADLQSAVSDLCLQRDRMVSAIHDLGLQTIPSDANFVMFESFVDAGVLWQQLLDRGVLVRDVGISGWLRVSAGTEPETDAFIAALRECVGHNGATP